MKRFTIEVDHKIIKEFDSAKEAEHFFHIEVRSRRGSGESIGIFDNRDDRWARVPEKS